MRYNSVFSFFWYHIKPYKWFYAVMLLAPIVSSFHYVVYNYAVKLFLDAMTEDQIFTYEGIMMPIFLFLSTHYKMIMRFYDPSKDVYVGLAQLYCEHPGFRKFFDVHHLKLTEFIAEAMRVYAQKNL